MPSLEQFLTEKKGGPYVSKPSLYSEHRIRSLKRFKAIAAHLGHEVRGPEEDNSYHMYDKDGMHKGSYGTDNHGSGGWVWHVDVIKMAESMEHIKENISKPNVYSEHRVNSLKKFKSIATKLNYTTHGPDMHGNHIMRNERGTLFGAYGPHHEFAGSQGWVWHPSEIDLTGLSEEVELNEAQTSSEWSMSDQIRRRFRQRIYNLRNKNSSRRVRTRQWQKANT